MATIRPLRRPNTPIQSGSAIGTSPSISSVPFCLLYCSSLLHSDGTGRGSFDQGLPRHSVCSTGQPCFPAYRPESSPQIPLSERHVPMCGRTSGHDALADRTRLQTPLIFRFVTFILLLIFRATSRTPENERCGTQTNSPRLALNSIGISAGVMVAVPAQFFYANVC